MTGFLNYYTDRFFSLDGGFSALALRVAILLFAAIFLWRFIYFALQEPPRSPVVPPPLVAPQVLLPPPNGRRWFPSRRERLFEAIELVRTETDELLAETDRTKATAGLARARAELAVLIREIEHDNEPEHIESSRPEPALTAAQIHSVIGLLDDLSGEQKDRLSDLIMACLEEARS